MPQLTRSEAEAVLPHVASLVEDLQRRIQAFQRQPSDPLAQEIRALLAELEQHGAEIKDPASGLIDFRTLRDGREVYLCWRLGEGPRILYWHDLDAGFAGRQPLDRLN